MNPTRARLVRATLTPLALAAAPLFWVAEATRRAALTPLGRDQGIFQYVAWALTAGAVDYRDVRDVNGPLAHLVHLALLSLGGADEHRFRVLDLAVTGATFALVGACLPGLRSRRAPDALERAAWALAGWVVLSAQYLLFGYWDLAQRESFFDWFTLPSVALQLVAQAPWMRAVPRRRALLFAAVGALSVVPWFGKPTYALFTFVQLAVIVVDDARSHGRAAWAFAIGGAVGAASQVAFLAAYGDVGAYVRIQLVDVPAMYRFIWPRSAADMFSEPWRASQAIFSLGGAALLAGLVALGELPVRALPVALAPLAALAGVVVQRKGFPYHFHPVTAGVHLQWLALAAWLSERARVARRRWAAARAAPLALAVLIGVRVAAAMEDSPHVRAAWLTWGARTPEQRATREYFARFPEPDFFPFELRQAAGFVRARTAPTERVQTYGMDPYVLFLAARLSATPYIYAYDLNVDAALAGGTGGRPSEAQADRIRAMREEHETDLVERLRAQPPAAFVFVDGAPLVTRADAWDDFEEHCPRAAAWVRPRYREAARFGHVHVWLDAQRAAPELERNEPAEQDDPTPTAP
ncbi:MAG TPA: hypothetical protein VE987_14315 [Polyangiaceae bacterium]|nr:hypothetical protein [Polyangiaceae bacterium]